jgi:hypothetical protein
MSAAIKLLESLNRKGIGYYEQINPLLKELFSEEDYSDFASFETKSRIWKFLFDLREHGLIKYTTTKNPFIVKAAIQPQGVQHLLELQEEIKKQQEANPKKKKTRWDIIGLVAIAITVILWLIDRFILNIRS